MTRLDKLIRTFYAIFFLFGVGHAAAEDDLLKSEFAEAKQIALHEWSLESASLSINDGASASASPDGTVSIGRGFLKSFTDGLATADSRTAIEFVMLHELVHVSQKNTLPAAAPDDPVRKPFECQADLLAAFALVDFKTKHPNSNGPDNSKELDSLIYLLRSLGAHAENTTALSAGGGHLDRRQRVLAVQFGYERALLARRSNRSVAASESGSDPAAFVGPNSNDLFKWSLEICRAITRSDPSTVEALVPFASINVDDNSLDFDNKTQHFGFKFTNNSGRAVRVHFIALSGNWPLTGKDDFIRYRFIGASHAIIEIPARSEGQLSGEVALAFGDPSEVGGFFSWTLPFDTNTLVSATYVGSVTAKPNCNSGWSSLGNSPYEQMAAALVRIGADARNQFHNIMGDPLFPGFGNAVYQSKIHVPGAQQVIVNPALNSVDVVLLVGEDPNEARKKYEEAKSALVHLCSEPGVDMNESTTDAGSQAFYINNLTGYSRANISLFTSKADPKKPSDKQKYYVSIYIYPIEIE